MKLAVDVKGTLEGPKKQQILKIIGLFMNAGYEITIWSNLYSYAVDAMMKNNLKADVDQKRSKSDYPFDNDESKFFDFAIEDDRQQKWLATKKFIFVDDIPEDMASIDDFVKDLLSGSNELTKAAIETLKKLNALSDEELKKKFDEFEKDEEK